MPHFCHLFSLSRPPSLPPSLPHSLTPSPLPPPSQVMLAFNQISCPVNSKLCVVTDTDLGPPLPPQVHGVNVTQTRFTEDYSTKKRAVTVTASFKWNQPVLLYGTLVEYDVYLSDGRALIGNEMANKDVNPVSINKFTQ